MILDRLENLGRYGLPFTEDIRSFLSEKREGLFTAPEIEIKGRDLFVRPGAYRTRPAEEGRFETHQVYADLQLMVSGEEIMQFAPLDSLSDPTEYDETKDCQFFSARANISSFLVREGEFAIFFSGESHRPMCAASQGPAFVQKLVFKIRIRK